MSTPQEFEEIAANFELFDDWEERYRYVIDLGRAMEPLPESQRTETTRVHGCASQVWIVPELREGPGGERLHFAGDSDAMIVRGLIAILRALCSGRPPAEVATVDAEAELGRLGLESHLSAQRSNGLRAMVARLRELAAAAEAG